MSYSIMITGHIAYASSEEVKTIEEEMIDKVSEFVDELEGVAQATFTGQYTGQQVIQPLS